MTTTDPDVAAFQTLIEAEALHTAARLELDRVRELANETIAEALLVTEQLRELVGRMRTATETVERCMMHVARARDAVDDTPSVRYESGCDE